MPVQVLWFLVGFSIGLSLGIWRLSRQNIRLQRLLHRLGTEAATSASDSTAQLARAIADRETDHAQLTQTLNDYQRILQAAPIGYLQVDSENQLIWCNSQTGQLLNLGSDAMDRPRLLLEVIRSYDLDQLIEQTRQTQKPCTLEWVFHSVDPDPTNPRQRPSYPLRGHGFPLSKGGVGIFLENRLETEILKQQRDRWASDVAHELKTPLTSIRLVAETLKPRVGQALESWIDRLLNETIRLGTLVEDLLNLSRIEGQAFPDLNLKPVNLPQLVRDAWQSLDPIARVKQLEMQLQGPGDLFVRLDESLMHRVMINLLDNAIKYSPPQETIWVRITPPSRNSKTSTNVLLIEVVDAGQGFQEKDLPHVFDRFYRADPARARQALPDVNSEDFAKFPSHLRGSTGLGLAIVRQIVDAHQGTIEASNHPEIGGGWLKICLPGDLVKSD